MQSYHAILEYIHREACTIDRAIEAVRLEDLRGTNYIHKQHHEDALTKARRGENEACARVLERFVSCLLWPANMDQYGVALRDDLVKLVATVRARIGKEGE